MVRLEWCALDGRGSNEGLRGRLVRRGSGVRVLGGEVALGVLLGEGTGGVGGRDGAVVRERADRSSVRKLGDFGGFGDLRGSWLAFSCDKLAEPSFERRPERVDRRSRNLEGEPGSALVVAGGGDEAVREGLDLRDEAGVVEGGGRVGELERIDDGVGVPEKSRSVGLRSKGRGKGRTSALAKHGQHRRAASRGRGGKLGGGGSPRTALDP